MIRSETIPGSRNKRYLAEDVRALRGGKGTAALSAADAPASPIFDSAITLIADGAFYYRGVPVQQLAQSATLEEVASLLWAMTDDPFRRETDPYPNLPNPGDDLDIAERMMALLPLAQAKDPAAFTMTPAALARTGARIVVLLAQIAAARSWSNLPIHKMLATSWTKDRPHAEHLIRAALVVLADHEFNASTFTMRCVISTRPPIHSAVAAALASLRGPRHGGMVAQVEAILDDIADDTPARAMEALRRRMKRGDRLFGFGHPLYPEGDPRASILVKMMRDSAPREPRLAQGLAFISAAEEITGEKPNIDVAVAILCRHLGLRPGMGFALFAVARTVGWIAHAIEQIGRPELIRPRARYIGPPPA